MIYLRVTIAMVLCFGSVVLASDDGSDPTGLLLKDFRPVSVYEVGETRIGRAAYPAVDMHAHAYADSRGELDRWTG